MKQAKKILYVIMALLPIISLFFPMFFFFQGARASAESLGETFEIAMIIATPGSYELEKENEEEINITEVVPGYMTAITESIMNIGANKYTPFTQAVLKMAYFMGENISINPTLFLCIFACMYHLFIMYIIELLMSVICFIPKKCSEILGG